MNAKIKHYTDSPTTGIQQTAFWNVFCILKGSTLLHNNGDT